MKVAGETLNVNPIVAIVIFPSNSGSSQYCPVAPVRPQQARGPGQGENSERGIFSRGPLGIVARPAAVLRLRLDDPTRDLLVPVVVAELFHLGGKPIKTLLVTYTNAMHRVITISQQFQQQVLFQLTQSLKNHQQTVL